VHVIHLISGDLWAGAEVATFHLLRALRARRDLSVGAIVLNSGELVERLREAGIPVSVIPEETRSFWELLRAVRRELAHAELVHSHRYKEDLLAFLAGRPWVSTQHGRPEPFPVGKAVRLAVFRAGADVARRLGARRVIAVSSEVEEALSPRVGRRKLVRAWNGIADPQAGHSAIPWSARPRRVGVLGRLAPVKRFALAVAAVARCPDLELEIVGEGPEREALVRQIESLGLADRVRLLGHHAHPLALVARWRALLVPSLHEGNPIAVLEALGLGTPVLSGPLRGVLEITEQRCGWVVPDAHSPESWAASLSRIVDDAAGGEAASAAARARYVAAFTSEAAAERVRAVYMTALGRPREGVAQTAHRPW
jgi:glycosyltransferase involved in cell wall biosynthesis